MREIATSEIARVCRPVLDAVRRGLFAKTPRAPTWQRGCNSGEASRKRETKTKNGNRNTQVLKKEKVMKKVLGTALVAAILVAALPTTASASLGFTGSKNCVGGSWLRPCRAPMPPSSSGTGRGSSSNGTNRSGSTGNAGTSHSGGKGALPPGPISGR
jgi:hypothetical protein